MKKTLFIDFDGTLCHDRFWRSLEPELRQRVQQHLFTSNKATVSDWMKGTYTSEDIHKKLAEDLDIDYNFLWNIFVKDCQNMKVEQEELQKIKELRNDYTIVLITDNMDCLDRFTVPALKLSEYFDVIVNSYNERVLKNENEGQLFREVIKRIGSTPPNSILIDNSEKSCGIFEKVGGMSYLATKGKSLSRWLQDL